MLVDAPANPMCLTCMATPFAGAAEKVNSLSIKEYAVICWVTPSSVTSRSLILGGNLDNEKLVVEPSPVNASTLLSEISKVSCASPIKLPQKMSLDVGAVLNKIFLFWTAYPSVKEESFLLGLCITLLIATCNCVASEILGELPLLWVILNFVFVPSNAAVNVWDVPEPTDDKFIFTLVFAFDNVYRNPALVLTHKILISYSPYYFNAYIK